MPSDEIIDMEPSQRRPENTLRTWGWISYAVHLVVAVTAVVPGAQFSPLLLLLGLGIDLVMRDDARGTWQESHVSWRLRSVIWAAVLYAITAPLWVLLFVPGWLAWTVISLWFLYRIVRGMICMDRSVAIRTGR